jgi:ribose/xylose/arabinose/galactoside ABC-type transport system permease subunit
MGSGDVGLIFCLLAWLDTLSSLLGIHNISAQILSVIKELFIVNYIFLNRANRTSNQQLTG